MDIRPAEQQPNEQSSESLPSEGSVADSLSIIAEPSAPPPHASFSEIEDVTGGIGTADTLPDPS